MIIKSMSRKEPSFGQLVNYMLNPKKAQLGILHNLPIQAQTPESIIDTFLENHAFLPSRANGNVLYHEIIALEPNEKLSVKEQAKALSKIAARYLDRRAKNQLAIGIIHAETAHVHMHLMISSNGIFSKRRIWMQKAEFSEIQKDLEAYQLKNFPELGTAQHYARDHQGPKRSNSEQSAELRRGKPSHKDELAATLTAIFENSNNREVLDKALANLDLKLYQRGRSVGVQTDGGRKYRLRTLGLAEAYTEAVTRFELFESRLASLEKGRGKGEPELER